jgi:predicted transcriptional regulator
MGEIYRVEELRLRVLNLLRKQGTMKSGPICVALGLPYWAVSSALDSALKGGLVTYEPVLGFGVVELAPAKPESTDWSAA